MASVIDQLNAVTQNLDLLASALSDVTLSQAELQTLEILSASLRDAVVSIEAKAGAKRQVWTEQIWKASEEHRVRAETTVSEFLSSGKLRNPAVFRRNIKLIFQGPPGSEFDSKDTKWRKEVIQKRCERIQQLSVDGVISWAMSHPPSTWGPCFMPNDIFDCLIDDIEPRDRKNWPEVIRNTLLRLKGGEAHGCLGLDQLLHGM